MPPEDYGQIRGGCSFSWMITVDWCFRTMPYSMQPTEQIPNDPPRMGAKSTTTSNHPSTPNALSTEIFLTVIAGWPH